jgi:hypothetical protein
VDRTAKEIFKILFDRHEIEQSASGRKVYQNIYITRFGGRSLRKRPKQPNIPCTIPLGNLPNILFSQHYIRGFRRRHFQPLVQILTRNRCAVHGKKIEGRRDKDRWTIAFGWDDRYARTMDVNDEKKVF